MKSVRKRSHQTDSNQIHVSIISHKHNGLRNNDTMDDTKKAILYPKAASDSKKERYMLELLPDKNKLAVQTKEPLRKIQDILGSIHDTDFTICYLQPLPQSSKEITR
jgi:hypothetical protein